jgi:hypothetical protein
MRRVRQDICRAIRANYPVVCPKIGPFGGRDFVIRCVTVITDVRRCICLRQINPRRQKILYFFFRKKEFRRIPRILSPRPPTDNE